MYYYSVIFNGTPYKEYFYKSEIKLPLNSICKIVADNKTEYKNPVMIKRQVPYNEAVTLQKLLILRTITSYKVIKGSPRPNDRINKVYFNKEKGTTCVIWDDGTKTIVRCAPCDTWDEEKALALCYMKRVLGNRGSFNETLKKYCYNSEENK